MFNLYKLEIDKKLNKSNLETVYCKIELPKVADGNWRMLHLQKYFAFFSKKCLQKTIILSGGNNMCSLKYWKAVEECNDDNNNPTVWTKTINHEKYGKYCWITFDGKNYLVEVSTVGEFVVLAKCKSLKSAKRWVTMNLAC